MTLSQPFCQLKISVRTRTSKELSLMALVEKSAI
uniref:Uncharacterized protein n=1 Tax=Arundo donax TaxID=35708 RepID=A0A0A8YMF6_ARUDO